MIDGFVGLHHIMQQHAGLDMINQKQYIIQEITQQV